MPLSQNKASLKTTVPMFIVKQWNLKAGEEVEYNLKYIGLIGNVLEVAVSTAPTAPTAFICFLLFISTNSFSFLMIFLLENRKRKCF